MARLNFPASPTHNQEYVFDSATYVFDSDKPGWGSGQLIISDDSSTNSALYPMFSSTNAGQLKTLKVNSSKLTYNPSTGIISSVDYNSTSDEKLKINLNSNFEAINIINSIVPYSFDWKDNGNKSWGVIAQEIEKILPELVSDVNEIKHVAYLPLIAILIKAIQELDKKIKEGK